MNIEKANEVYYKLKEDSDIFFWIKLDNERNVTVTEVSDAGIIIYDTRISGKAVDDKFGELKLLNSTKEEFYKKYREIEDRDLNE